MLVFRVLHHWNTTLVLLGGTHPEVLRIHVMICQAMRLALINMGLVALVDEPINGEPDASKAASSTSDSITVASTFRNMLEFATAVALPSAELKDIISNLQVSMLMLSCEIRTSTTSDGCADLLIPSSCHRSAASRSEHVSAGEALSASHSGRSSNHSAGGSRGAPTSHAPSAGLVGDTFLGRLRLVRRTPTPTDTSPSVGVSGRSHPSSRHSGGKPDAPPVGGAAQSHPSC